DDAGVAFGVGEDRVRDRHEARGQAENDLNRAGEYVGDDPGHLAERRGHELHCRTDPHVRRVRERGLALGIELHLPVLPDDGAGSDRGGDREGEVLTAAVDDDLRRGLAAGADRAGDLLHVETFCPPHSSTRSPGWKPAATAGAAGSSAAHSAIPSGTHSETLPSLFVAVAVPNPVSTTANSTTARMRLTTGPPNITASFFGVDRA